MISSINEALIREIDDRLRNAYGLSRLGNKDDPLDELIFIILSGATQEVKYNATFDALRSAFPTWNNAAQAAPEAIESVIRFGGLAKKKSTAITKLLAAIVEQVGQADLSFLHDLGVIVFFPGKYTLSKKRRFIAFCCHQMAVSWTISAAFCSSLSWFRRRISATESSVQRARSAHAASIWGVNREHSNERPLTVWCAHALAGWPAAHPTAPAGMRAVAASGAGRPCGSG